MSFHQTFYKEEIFPQDQQENIKMFKYSGTDKSILYRYLYSPFAQFIVDKIMPESIA